MHLFWCLLLGLTASLATVCGQSISELLASKVMLTMVEYKFMPI